MSGTWKDRKMYIQKEFWKHNIFGNYIMNYSHIPSWFKKMRRRIRRAKVKDAMNKGNYDCLPRFRNEDTWLWW